MATLRELRKRLKSIKTTGQLAGAMRTVAAAKYAKVSAVKNGFAEYSAELASAELASAEAAGAQAPSPSEKKPDGRRAFVLVSGNRGLCGGYNHELFAYFAELKKAFTDALVIAAGRMAADYCREKKIEISKTFSISDVPEFQEAKALAVYLTELYDGGEAQEIVFVCQHFYNMIRQKPEAVAFLPEDGSDDALKQDEELLFIPDRETLVKELRPLSLAARVYSILLSSAAGAQAATVMAMRSAYDSANTSSLKLETAINRMRQAQVTAEMTETQN